jgi:ribosomal protein S18 acetylase RimI-like enzyme
VTVDVRAMRADEFDAFLAHVKRVYVDDMVDAGIAREEAEAKSERDHAQLLPDGVATKSASLYVVDEDSDAAGYLWLAERTGDHGANLFVYGVEIAEDRRGRGLGRAAMAFTEDEARRRGIATVALNVFGGNDAARGLYRSLGYRETAILMEKRL